MAEIPDFQRRQYEFAAHIRDPEHNAAPAGIEDRRMAIYRELFFNNLQSLLGSTFPVLKKVCGTSRWRGLIREFMARHRAQTPYFLEIPKEFLAFLEREYRPRADDYSFLTELAHYEWIELAVSISMDRDDLTMIDPAGDLLEGIPVMSVLARPLAYRFPVQRISEKYRPDEPGKQTTHLVVFRKPDNHVGFMELNAMTADLLNRVADNPERHSGRTLLLRLARDSNYEPHALLGHGAAALREMRDTDILIGTAKTP